MIATVGALGFAVSAQLFSDAADSARHSELDGVRLELREELGEALSANQARLDELQNLHLAIHDRLFVGPEVSRAWYEQLVPFQEDEAGVGGAGDDAGAADLASVRAGNQTDRPPLAADLARQAAELDQLLAQNRGYVQVYGGYLRGVPHRWPVVHGPRVINSNYGFRRSPFARRWGVAAPRKLHRGGDLKGKRGDLVVSAAEGIVMEARRSSRGYGNRVRVFHPSGYITLYAHLSKIYVKTNDYLRPGDRVGAVGSTGHSTGPHLHYEVHRSGKAINPAEFIAEE